MDVTRVALIGTSEWAQMMHLKSLRSDPRCVVTAICGSNEERTRKIAAQHHINRAYTNYLTLFEQEELDAVAVCVPNDLHHPIAVQALLRGKHVLCEKPLAINELQAKEMFELARRACVAHMVCFTYRWMPAFRFLKVLLDDGYVGEMIQLGISYLSGFGVRPEASWRFDSARAGGGVVADLGSHAIDLARWFAGDILSVSSCFAKTIQRGSSCEAEDSATLTLRHTSGAVGHIHVSAVAWLGHADRELLRVEVLGAEGSLWLEFGWDIATSVRGVRTEETALHALTIPDELWCGAPRDNPEATLQYLVSNTSHGPRSFLDAIHDGKSPVPSFYDGWKVQEVIGAAYASHSTGQRVAAGKQEGRESPSQPIGT